MLILPSIKRDKVVLKNGSAFVAMAVAAAFGIFAATGAAMAQQRGAQQPAPTPAPAPAARPAAVPQPVPEKFESWSLRCFQDAKGGQACRIEALVMDANNRPQLALIVRPPAAADQPPVGTLTPPWGVLLARGLDMQVDGQPALRVPIRTCFPSGCIADFSLIDSINAQWQKGATLKVTMAAANGQPLSIDVPLAGYPKAYARLLEKSKR